MTTLDELFALFSEYRLKYGKSPAYFTCDPQFLAEYTNDAALVAPYLSVASNTSHNIFCGIAIWGGYTYQHRLTAGVEEMLPSTMPTVAIPAPGINPMPVPNSWVTSKYLPVPNTYDLIKTTCATNLDYGKPTCECGAHKVSSSNHSGWCPIK